jgi:hypothetical protein
VGIKLRITRYINICNYLLGRVFHSELFIIARDVRNRVVNFSDENMAKWILKQSDISSSTILPESLAIEIRQVYPYFRQACTYLEDFWFIQEFSGSFQGCFACPSNGIQAELAALRLLCDGYFSSNRFLSAARQLRHIHPGYFGSLLLDPGDVIDFGKEYGKLPEQSTQGN